MNFWRIISDIGVRPEYSKKTQIRLRTTNQFLFIAAVLLMAAAGIFWNAGLAVASRFCFGTAFILVFAIFLNKLGYFEFGAYYLIITSNLIVFLLDNWVGIQGGTFIYYFTIMLASAFVIEKPKSVMMLLILAYPLLLFLLSAFTGHRLFGNSGLSGDSLTLYVYTNVILNFILVQFLAYVFVTTYFSTSRYLREQNRKLSKLNEDLDRFVYSASHDLRAPIASLLGLVDIARKEKDPSRIVTYLDMKEKSLRKLDRFIQDIIGYSRNSRLKVSKNPVDLGKTVRQIFEQNQYLYDGSSFETEVQVKSEGSFYSDEGRLKIVLQNIITNAIHYRDPEKPNSYVKVEAETNAIEGKIKVIDNGTGIESTETEKIFEMFYRANESSPGTGLGLFIVKETIEKLQGTVEVVSQVGKGSTFTIRIPNHRNMEKADAPKEEHQDTGRDDVANQSLPGKT